MAPSSTNTSSSVGDHPPKYPSTAHLSYSPGVNADDIVATSSKQLFDPDIEIVITEKLDGGNCCLFGGNVYARSTKHATTLPWFGRIKQLYISWVSEGLVPENIALYGENMSAIHSIEYDALASSFYLFGALEIPLSKGSSRWLSWDEVLALAIRLQVHIVPEIIRAPMGTISNLELWMQEHATNKSRASNKVSPEGFVIRCTRSFPENDFSKCVFKYVRANHAQTEPDFRRNWKKAMILETPPQAASSSATLASLKVSTSSRSRPSKTVPLLVLVGLPGAGKSLFSRSLQQSHPRHWVVVNQDTIGSRSGCETAMAKALKSGHSVVLDRCNVTRQERKELWKTAFQPKMSAAYFNVPAKECLQRIRCRVGHPTIRNGHGAGVGAVRQFESKLEAPTVEEGFDDVWTISTLEDMKDILHIFGAELMQSTDSFSDDLSARADFDVSLLITMLKLNDSDVVGVFLVGSRLWGYSNDQSDYDFVIITRRSTDSKQAHCGQSIDATLISEDEFHNKVTNYKFNAVLLYHLPDAFVWRRPSFIPRFGARLRIDAWDFYAAIADQVEQSLSQLRKHLSKHKSNLAQQTLLSVLRNSDFAGQIINCGQVTSFRSSKRWRDEIMQEMAAVSFDPELFMNKWSDQVQEHMHRLDLECKQANASQYSAAAAK